MPKTQLFVTENKFANISHRIVINDLHDYFDYYFDTVFLNRDYEMPRKIFRAAQKNNLDYLFVQAGPT